MNLHSYRGAAAAVVVSCTRTAVSVVSGDSASVKGRGRKVVVSMTSGLPSDGTIFAAAVVASAEKKNTMLIIFL